LPASLAPARQAAGQGACGERATTTTVPNVTGGTEGQADAAISAAGLTAAPTYVMSPGTPGTVLDQNSPAGTVEPTGSPVQITISLGQTSVPNVLSFDQASAEQAIGNAGLTVGGVSHVNNCVDPGTVQTQNPSAGVQLSLGSSVNIQVSTCNSGGGGGGGGHPILPK
jgi:beta-lactam-binding protein with PASTA domain